MVGEELIYSASKDGVKFILDHRPAPIIQHSYAMLDASNDMMTKCFKCLSPAEKAKFTQDMARVISDLKALEDRINEAKSWTSKIKFYIPAITKAHNLAGRAKKVASEVQSSSRYAQAKWQESKAKQGDADRCISRVFILSPQGDYALNVPEGNEAEITCILRYKLRPSVEQLMSLEGSSTIAIAPPIDIVAVTDPRDARIRILSPYGEYTLNIPSEKEVEISCKIHRCSESDGTTPVLTATRKVNHETRDETTVILVPANVQLHDAPISPATNVVGVLPASPLDITPFSTSHLAIGPCIEEDQMRELIVTTLTCEKLLNSSQPS